MIYHQLLQKQIDTGQSVAARLVNFDVDAHP
jgi:hypothetical protein